MSKTDTDLNDISLDKTGGSIEDSRRLTTDFDAGRSINVFDYETVAGMPFMLATKYGDDEAEVVTTDADTPEGTRYGPLPTHIALSYLHNTKTRNRALNFWYNLNFDVNVFLKDLDDSVLQKLRATNSATTEIAGKTIQLTYIPKKLLEIRDDNGNVSRHYDVAQFTYSGTLENAVSDWLDGEDGKADDDLDPKPGEDGWDDSLKARDDPNQKAYVGGGVWEQRDDVARYAREDARLTQDIARTIIEVAEDEMSDEIPFAKPYSTGYVAGQYVLKHADAMPQFRTKGLQRAALKSYAGGRFEIYERGLCEEAVAGPDINSAYPWVMASLPSLARQRIDHISDVDDPMAAIRETYGDDYYDLSGYAFVKVRVSTDDSRRIQPFAVKSDDTGRVEYPALENGEIWTIGPILAHAVDAGYVEEIEFLDGFVTRPDDRLYDDEVPRAFAEKGIDLAGLYAKRKALEADGRDRAAKLVKIVLNSLYGKTCQIDAKRGYFSDYLDDEDTDVDALREAMPDDPDRSIDDVIDALSAGSADDALPREARLTSHVVDGNPIVEEYRAGRFFNPAIAAYTTGMTRLKLHESVVSNGLEDDTLMLATDCMLVRKEPFDATPLAEEADSDPDKTDSAAMRDALGGWDYDYRGYDGALIMASGVYEVYGVPDGDGGRGTYTKARGFKKLLSDDYPTLRGCIEGEEGPRGKVLSDDEMGLEVVNNRPRTFGEVVFQGKSLRKIGEFFDSRRKLKADMDGKRVWESTPSMPDLLEGVEVGGVKTERNRTVD